MGLAPSARVRPTLEGVFDPISQKPLAVPVGCSLHQSKKKLLLLLLTIKDISTCGRIHKLCYDSPLFCLSSLGENTAVK